MRLYKTKHINSHTRTIVVTESKLMESTIYDLDKGYLSPRDIRVKHIKHPYRTRWMYLITHERFKLILHYQNKNYLLIYNK